MDAMEQALEMSRELNTPRLEAASLGFGADVLMDLGLTEKGRDYATRALQLTEQMHSTFAKGRLYALLGWTDIRGGDVTSARERFEEARRLAEGVLTEELMSYRIELAAWDDAGRPDELVDAAERLRGAAEGESLNFLAWARYGLGRAALLRGDLESAQEHARAALELAAQSGERGAECRAHNVLAEVLERQGRNQEAAAEARRAAEWIDRMAGKLPTDVRSAFVSQPLFRDVVSARDRLNA
jgi:tetratricopeptide (TPR) repeat protein